MTDDMFAAATSTDVSSARLIKFSKASIDLAGVPYSS